MSVVAMPWSDTTTTLTMFVRLRMEALEDVTHQGISPCDGFPDFRAVWAVCVTIAIYIGNIRSDELGSRSSRTCANVFRTGQIKEPHDAIDLSGENF